MVAHTGRQKHEPEGQSGDHHGRHPGLRRERAYLQLKRRPIPQSGRHPVDGPSSGPARGGGERHGRRGQTRTAVGTPTGPAVEYVGAAKPSAKLIGQRHHLLVQRRRSAGGGLHRGGTELQTGPQPPGDGLQEAGKLRLDHPVATMAISP